MQKELGHIIIGCIWIIMGTYSLYRFVKSFKKNSKGDRKATEDEKIFRRFDYINQVKSFFAGIGLIIVGILIIFS